MKASQIKISTFETYEDHYDAIHAIENDPDNYIGGIEAWVSGRQVYMTKTAENKIKAIKNRIEKKFPCTDED